MSSVLSAIINPEEEAIKAHLETLFAPARDEYPGGLVELRYGRDGSLSSFAYFGMSPERLAEAAEFAAERSRAGNNVYVGVNPRKPSTDTRRAGSADDVEIAFWQFADLDDPEAVLAVVDRVAHLKPTFTVTTGTAPHKRPHFYWQLEEPVRNLAAWTERQRGVAQALGGDSVIDPPRIMRLAGTVNFPPQHKVAKGYRTEIVKMRTQFAEERGPYSAEQIAAAFPVRQVTETVTPSVGPGQTTLSTMRPTRIHDLIEACRSGEQWHNNMIRLVAHLAALGRTSAEIVALADHITLPGYTAAQTVREMTTALVGARQKWALPEPVEAPVEAEEQAREPGDSTFELLDLDELEQMPPPTWLIHEILAEEGLTVVYGDPGAGKSFIALDMALRIAHGMEWHGAQARATGVLYIAGEGVRGLGKRVKGWRREHNMEGVEAPFLLVPVAVQLLDPKQREKLIRTVTAAMERAGFAIGLVIIDTVSRALAGADENGQEAMSAFVAACDEIRRHAGGALLGVHHSGKDKDRGMRGSTVLLGACDASIRITKTGQTVTLKTEKQKDAEEAEPIYMEMRKVSWATGLEEEQSTLVPFRSEAPPKEEVAEISRHRLKEAQALIQRRWEEGKPLSSYPQAKRRGAYAPEVIAPAIDAPIRLVESYLGDWLTNGVIVVEQQTSHSRATGLRVEKWLD